MKKKRILILGASKDQMPMIRLAKHLGFYTIAIDFNEKSPGIAIADEFHLINIRDEAAVEKIARQLQVHGITSMITEAGALSIFSSCSHLNLPNTYSLKSAEATVSKERMREILEDNNINDLPFSMPETLSDAETFASSHGFPLVLKSSDSGGQNGLFKVNDEESLQKSFFLSKADSFGGKVILEKYIEGPELNVVLTVSNGVIMDFLISDRIKDSCAFGIVKRHQYPSAFSSQISDKLRVKCQAIVNALDIDNAVVFPQFIYTAASNEATLLEIGVRIPGGIMDQFFELVTGINLQEFVLDIALGQLKDYEYYRQGEPKAAALVTFLNAEPGPLLTGKIQSCKGISEAREIPGVANLDYFFQSGENLEITPLKRGRDRFFYIVSYGDNIHEAHDASKAVFQTLRFQSPDGKELIKPTFNFDEFYHHE